MKYGHTHMTNMVIIQTQIKGMSYRRAHLHSTAMNLEKRRGIFFPPLSTGASMPRKVSRIVTNGMSSLQKSGGGRELPLNGRKSGKIRVWAATTSREMEWSPLEPPFFAATAPFRPGARQAGWGGHTAGLYREKRRMLLQEPAFPAGPKPGLL